MNHTGGNHRTRILAFVCLLAMLGCGVEKFSLPPQAGNGVGGVSDTTYLQLNSWIDLGSTEAEPEDIFINDDGLVYVAESGTGRISVWNQALLDINDPGPGQIHQEPALLDFELPGVKGVCVTAEQLLFAVDGSKRLWSVNLLARRSELLFVLTRLALIDEDGVADTLNIETFAGLLAQTPASVRAEWLITPLDSIPLGSAELDSMLSPRVFYEAFSDSNRFEAVAPGRAGKREVFFVNNNNSGGHRVSRLRYKPVALLLLAGDFSSISYLYEPYTAADSMGSNPGVPVVFSGTGQGTIDKGPSLALDCQDRLYFTQDSSYFHSQRLTLEEVDDQPFWSYDLSLAGSDLEDSDSYLRPVDVAFSNAHIFVCDQLGKRVQVFEQNGDYIRPCGASRVWRDTTVVVDGVQKNILVKDWAYDQLIAPTSVASFGNSSCRGGDLNEEVVFVADQGGTVTGPDGTQIQVNDRILLYTLSQSSDDLPDQ